MQYIRFIAIGLIVIAATGCQQNTAKQRVPFAEGKALVCPEHTRKAEELNSSYPEYFCVGTEGKSGTWMEFDMNGRIRTRAEYKKDKLNGPWIHYHPEGSIDTTGQMRDGERIGEWTQFYVNGAVRSIKTYANGLQNGPIKLYYQTGGLMAEGAFKDNLEQGPWKVYTPEGKLARECKMVDGKEKDCIIHIKDFQPATYKYNSQENGAL